MNAPAPPARALSEALGGHDALAGLLQRVRESQARLAAVEMLLPEGLRDGVRAGPLDDAAWVLLVSHAAAAAKLRQLLPALEATLRARGCEGPPIKIKVQPRQ